jgi:hypothetical protein
MCRFALEPFSGHGACSHSRRLSDTTHGAAGHGRPEAEGLGAASAFVTSFGLRGWVPYSMRKHARGDSLTKRKRRADRADHSGLALQPRCLAQQVGCFDAATMPGQ